ncbi:MAG: FGGY family carbohydrate kinase [Chloroflexota bacterium]|nr:FGGY family carbohydrate kinase [Chloroflexota bacterium]
MNRLSGSCVLGSDLGTSGCKSIVLDAEGNIRGWALEDYPTLRPHPGWAEQHPGDWFSAFRNTAQQAIRQAEVEPEEIAAVCIVGITHNAVLLDENDAVLRAAILYTDIRSQTQSEALLQKWGDAIFQRTFNPLSPVWTWPQLQWIKENEPEVWRQTRRILFPKDYVRHQIAPSFLTDTIDPVGTCLYDPLENQWIDLFCADLGLPPEVWPEPVEPWCVVGGVSKQAAAETGLVPGTPVIAGTTDTAAEVFGTGAIRPGQTTVKLATVGRIATISEDPVPDPTFFNYPHVLEGLWYPGTSTKFAASAFTWARRAFWDEGDRSHDYKLMDQAAAGVPPGAGGVIFHPYLAGEFAPSWDPYLRASFLGVGIQHNRAHFTRAVMEGVAFAIRDALESILATGLEVDEIRLIGGGAASDLWAQIMTDVLQRELLVPESADAAFGSALMAGVAAGMFEAKSDSIGDLIRIRARRFPDEKRSTLYDDLFGIYRQAAESISDVSHQLHHFQVKQGAGSK